MTTDENNESPSTRMWTRS